MQPGAVRSPQDVDDAAAGWPGAGRIRQTAPRAAEAARRHDRCARPPARACDDGPARRRRGRRLTRGQACRSRRHEPPADRCRCSVALKAMANRSLRLSTDAEARREPIARRRTPASSSRAEVRCVWARRLSHRGSGARWRRPSQARACRIRLNGVCSARRQWVKPASAKTSASRASPAWAPSTCWPPSESACAQQSVVDAE